MKQKDILRFFDTKRHNGQKADLAARKNTFAEIYRHQYDDIAIQADRCVNCGVPFCQWKCPVHNYIPGWLQLLYQNKLEEAVELCHQTNSLPEVCGRVCPQDRLCEGACTLNDGVGAVTIGAAEKYITDTMLAQNWRPKIAKIAPDAKQVAVVGGGPAGLACADILIRAGFRVTVFDAYPEIGGLLTFGIPEFKLEKSVIQLRRTFFSDLGVEFRCNVRIGDTLPITALAAEYEAIFLGIGAYKKVSAGLKNEHLAVQALDYLVGNVSNNMQYKSGFPFISVAGKRVIVLGGGDTAMDCVRTSVRLGAKAVTCVYRRAEADMPGSLREVAHATEEGVRFLFNRQPTAIHCDQQGAVTGVEVVHTAYRENDDSDSTATFSEWDKLVQLTIGCLTPNAHKKLYQITDSEETLDADIVIMAFGFRPEAMRWLTDAGVALDAHGRIVMSSDRLPGQTSVAHIFAAGDVVTGSDLVVRAIDAGRKAAHGIVTYLTTAG